MKERNISLDYMKAFAIFLVVLGHLLNIADSKENLIRELIWSVHMPIFFFVSGMLIHRKLESWETIKIFICKKIRLLIPLIVFGGGYTLYCKSTFHDFFFQWEKNGYWFLWVLFEMFLIYSLTNLVLIKNTKTIIEVVILLIPMFGCMILRKYSDTLIGGILNFLNLYNYCFMLIGIFIARYKLYKYVLNDLSLSIFIIIYLLGLFSKIDALNIPMKICGILFLYGTMTHITKRINRDNKKWSRDIILFIGESSLYIYVLHYFVFFGITKVPEPFYRIIFSTVAYYLPLYSLISLFIIAACLIAATVINQNKYLKLFLFGCK